MDSTEDPNFKLCGVFLQVQNTSPTSAFNKNETAGYVRYTRLPNYDFESSVQWPRKDSYVLQPRLRRIVTVNDEDNMLRMSRSLRSELGFPLMPSSTETRRTSSKRKICTIAEDEQPSILSSARDNKFSSHRRSPTIRSAKPIGYNAKTADSREETPVTPFKYLKKGNSDKKISAKSNSVNSRYLNTYKSKNLPTEAKARTDNSSENKSSTSNERRTTPYRHNKKPSSPIGSADVLKNARTNIQNTNVPRKYTRPTGKTVEQENKNDKKLVSFKKVQNNIEVENMTKFNNEDNKPRELNTVKKIQNRIVPALRNNKSYVIHVPRVENKHGLKIESGTCTETTSDIDVENNNFKIINTSDVIVGTDPLPDKVDMVTEINIQQKDSTIQTDDIQELFFENLEIPNYTLLKDRSTESKTDVMTICQTHSLPNLQVPSINISSSLEDKKSSLHRNTSSLSYIIGRATLTYTTKQKIDFHVVSSQDLTPNSTQSSPLTYPMNVMSVFKSELQKKKSNEPLSQKDEQKKRNHKRHEHSKSMNDLNSVYINNNSKLVKPSELINTINVNNSLLQNDDICEQFHRELNFIDSFIESLQYLENCCWSNNNTLTNKKVENWVSQSGFDVSNPEYDALFSKFENGTSIDDTETMAFKSLCLLNLLIRDEQKRAKNLLFVLKMREDALKDFTKSQILWLENKKKHENIDVPSLKKKQRGALLKLQHECGEMQRMRKALLALSEKRKLALMKTKKNIELKLKNNVSADQILLNKKKLKRSSNTERPPVPLKCFDLSSSGCEEGAPLRARSDSALQVSPPSPRPTHANAEKSIQTGDSLLVTARPQDVATDTTSENNVTVDGGYLNILFNNLKLPEMFNSHKQYEVNEEALKSIVKSANHHSATVLCDLADKVLDLIKNREQDISSSPSTARSLVEEFDQYYKDLTDEDKNVNAMSVAAGETCRLPDPVNEDRMCDTLVISEVVDEADDPVVSECTAGVQVEPCVVDAAVSPEPRVDAGAEARGAAGPLPTPPGSAAPPPAPTPTPTPAITDDEDVNLSMPPQELVSSATSEISSVEMTSSPPASLSPVHSEAEELRRQQLAIEREIKALEQQQSQLLVVREIPDKPPPPYTPPGDARAAAPPRMFLADDTLEQKVETAILNQEAQREIPINQLDPFDVFVQDFCAEATQKYKEEDSEKPWDACNLLPKKPPLTQEKLIERTVADLKDVLLTGATSTVSSGVSARRSDHIDDILFSEWRRCEPEWTSLHCDEVKVKSQIFENIFQRILTKTIDEYKNTVLS